MSDQPAAPKEPSAGDLVACDYCQRPTPYRPAGPGRNRPHPTEESLCDACQRQIEALRAEAEKNGRDWLD